MSGSLSPLLHLKTPLLAQPILHPPSVCDSLHSTDQFRLVAKATIVAASTVVAPTAFAAASFSVGASESNTLNSSTLFSSKSQSLSVQNGSRAQCMQVWNPIDSIKFETLSYLPALSTEAIAKQVDYMIQQKHIPCLEFDPVGTVSRKKQQQLWLLR